MHAYIQNNCVSVPECCVDLAVARQMTGETVGETEETVGETVGETEETAEETAEETVGETAGEIGETQDKVRVRIPQAQKRANTA